jgi:hypothetical protein
VCKQLVPFSARIGLEIVETLWQTLLLRLHGGSTSKAESGNAASDSKSASG